jgi:hypothetical protein
MIGSDDDDDDDDALENRGSMFFRNVISTN